jgi:hypothetical protein
MDQHYMLSMAGQQGRFQIEGVHIFTAPQSCRSSLDGSSKSRYMCRVW